MPNLDVATRPQDRPMPPELVAPHPGRLDAVLAELTGMPRAEIQRAIDAGRVTVDGQRRPRSFRLKGDERLAADLAHEEPLSPEGPPVPVRFRDEHLLVVSKPAGLVTHPTVTRRTGTLVNRLLGMGVPLAPGDPLRPGIVHRLDAGTSGLMVVAATEAAREPLEAMMRAHELDRRYLALVRGAVEPDDFSVEAPLGRGAARVVVDRTEGRPAETAFQMLERLPRATLLVAAPRTGRTHQIRVHLAAIGHPILGDRTYGGAGDDAAALGLWRPFLHAWRLGFDHPITGERIDLEEPLPADLAEALDRARGDQRR
jgi:23S rRNA pseudouridine1911/1915/1917 synthase